MSLPTTMGMVLGAALLAQPLPPELRQQGTTGPRFDPALPPALRSAVERAVEAELDPSRGTANGMEILKAEQRKYAGDRAMDLALQVRMGAMKLRSVFSTNSKVPPGMAYQQALSTYSKMDVTDPGLGPWIEKTLDKNPKAKKALAKDARKIRVTVLARGEGLAPAKFYQEIARALQGTGFELVRSKTAKKADYILKLGADQVRTPGEKPKVRVTLQISAVGSDWKKTLYRVTESDNPNDALGGATAWLSRIGGRDLLFSWLASHGLPGVIMQPPKRGHSH